MEKSLGDIILEKITQTNLFSVSYPDPEEAHVFVWSIGAAERLEAIFEQSKVEHDNQ